jgi:hypothetical protein
MIYHVAIIGTILKLQTFLGLPNFDLKIGTFLCLEILEPHNRKHNKFGHEKPFYYIFQYIFNL